MSFVTLIRDYVETLNTISSSFGENLTLTNFIYETLVYILKTLQSGFLYIVSFQWIRDFTLLPIVLPQFSSAIFKESFFLETPSKTFFEFLEIPDLHQNKFLLGVFNSFFLTLPFSIVHILSIRRLFIQGIPSGVYSIGGYLSGQILFVTFIVFGLREILIPWLTLEPLNYLVGIVLIFRIIYSMTQENLIELKGWGGYNFPKYRSFFLTSFVLAWCEQTSIFQYLGNVTLSSNVTILESFSTTSSISSFFTHCLYIFGISIGSILFTCVWGFFFLQVKNWFILYTPLFLSSIIQLINKTTFVLALSLTLTSIPFYGFDYLVTGPLGFISQDNVFKNTIIDQTRIKDYAARSLSSLESGYKYVDIEISPFDRGEYLTVPDVKQPLSFEDLNYRGEFDWTTRQAKLSGISDKKGGFLSVSKILKKKKQSQTSLTEKSNLNPLIPIEQAEEVNSLEFEAGSPLFERFNEFYGTGNGETDEITQPHKNLSSVSFPTDFLRAESMVEKGIEQKIKRKYESNPVYKILLTGDIDLFLKRQPQNFVLSADQEIDLYTKRRMLASYYDSLREYSNLPYTEEFDSFFDGTKSFSSKVYNQQFKGTWRSVRRLFTLTLDSENKESQKSILKFDEPLYQLSEKQTFSPYHEELSNQFKKSPEQFSQSENSEKFATRNNLWTTPLYAGWDERLRKFVITNKLVPRKVASYQVNIDSETRPKFSQESAKQSQKIEFTAWPLSTDSNQLLPPKEESLIPYVALYEPLDEKTKSSLGMSFSEGDGTQTIQTFPSNLEKWKFEQRKSEKGKQQSSVQESLVPKRGGFIWPGNSKLKLPSFSNF